MQVVILCAGKGVRMGDLTKDLPKPLLKINGKSLIECKLEKLPRNISEIILVIGYKGEKIQETFGNSYRNIPIKYATDETLTGTAHALWQARPLLHDRFLVMMGDDLYSSDALENCAQHDFSLACMKSDRNKTGSRVLLDDTGQPIDFVTHKMYLTLRDDGGLIFTGLYSMTPEIFKYEPVKLELSDEYGLPQTFLKLAENNKVDIIETDFWLPITTPEELNIEID